MPTSSRILARITLLGALVAASFVAVPAARADVPTVTADFSPATIAGGEATRVSGACPLNTGYVEGSTPPPTGPITGATVRLTPLEANPDAVPGNQQIPTEVTYGSGWDGQFAINVSASGGMRTELVNGAPQTREFGRDRAGQYRASVRCTVHRTDGDVVAGSVLAGYTVSSDQPFFTARRISPAELSISSGVCPGAGPYRSARVMVDTVNPSTFESRRLATYEARFSAAPVIPERTVPAPEDGWEVHLWATCDGGSSGAGAFFATHHYAVGTLTPPAPASQATAPTIEAKPDSYTAAAGRVLIVPAARGVLANDTGPKVRAAITTSPTAGRVTLSRTGAFNYRPMRGFTGVDSFVYRTAAGTARVTITVAV